MNGKKRSENCTSGISSTQLGQKLNIAAAVLANAVSEDLTVNQIELLSSFAQLVSQALTNIAVAKAAFDEKNEDIFIEE